MLSEENLRLREGRFTASMAPALMSGDDEMLLEMWRRSIGEIGELEQTWPMKLGSFLEPFILDHHQEKTGEPLIERGTFVAHPDREMVSCTLDCYRASDDTVIDAKVCGPWQSIDDIIKFYTPQIVIQQRCRCTARGALLIMHGTAEPKEYPVEFNDEYEQALWERVAAFQLCVTTLTPPVPLKKVVPPDKWRTVDLGEEYRSEWPNWGEEMRDKLALWRSHRVAANIFDTSAKDIKKLLPDDVGRVDCDGLLITRNRANAVSIKEMTP